MQGLNDSELVGFILKLGVFFKMNVELVVYNCCRTKLSRFNLV